MRLIGILVRLGGQLLHLLDLNLFLNFGINLLYPQLNLLIFIVFNLQHLYFVFLHLVFKLLLILIIIDHNLRLFIMLLSLSLFFYEVLLSLCLEFLNQLLLLKTNMIS